MSMGGQVYGRGILSIDAELNDSSLNAAARRAQATLDLVGKGMQRNLADAGLRGVQVAARAMNGIVTAARNVGSATATVFTRLGTGIRRALDPAITVVTQKLRNFQYGFRDSTAAASALTGVFGTLGGVAQRAFGPAIRGVQDFISGFRSTDAAISSFTGQLGISGAVARETFDRIVAGASRMTAPLLAPVQNFISGFRDAQAASSALTGVLGTVGGAARRAFDGIPGAARSAFDTVVNAAGTAASGIGRAFSAVGGTIGRALSSAGRTAMDAMGQTLKIGAAAAGTAVAATLGTAFGRGFNRLSSIDAAEKRLEGMGQNVESVMASVDAAATDTAFALDTVASAASGLAVSGIQAGDSMDFALEGLIAASSAAGGTNEAMDGLSEVWQRAAQDGRVMGDTLYQLSRNGVPAVAALAEELGKTPEEIRKMASESEISFDQFNSAMINQLGDLSEAMAMTWDGMRGNVLSNLGRIGAAVQKPLFDALIAAMPGVVQMMRNLASAVTEAMEPFEGRFTERATAFGEMLGNMEINLGPIIETFKLLGPAIGIAAAAFAGPLLQSLPIVGRLFTGLTGPVGLVIGLFATMVAVSEPLREAFGDLFSALGEAFSGMGDSVGGLNDVFFGLMETLGGALASVIQALIPLIEPVMAIFEALVPVIEIIAEVVGQVAAEFAGAFATALTAIAPVLVQVAGVIGQLAPILGEVAMAVMPLVTSFLDLLTPILTLIDPLMELVQLVLPMLVDLFGAVLPPVIAFAQTIIDSLMPVIEGLVEILGGVITFLTGVFTGDWSMAWEGIKTIFTGLWNTIKAIFVGVWNVLVSLVQNGLALIKGIWESIWSAVGGFFEDIWNNIVQAVTRFVAILRTAITVFVNGVRTTWSNAWNAVRTAFTAVWRAIVQAGVNFTTRVRETFTRVVDFVRDIPNRIMEFFSNMGTMLLDSGRALIDGFLQGIKNAWGNITGWVSGAMENLRGLWPFSPAKWGPFSGRGWVTYSGQALGREFGESTRDALDQQVPAVAAAMQNIADAFEDVAVSDDFDEAFRIGESIALALAAGLLRHQSEVERAAQTLSASIDEAFGGTSLNLTSTVSSASSPAYAAQRQAPAPVSSEEGARLVALPEGLIQIVGPDPYVAARDTADRIAELAGL